jgi:hypothetical protein
MSQVARIKALLPLVTERPWQFAEKRPARARVIADVVTTPDCELFTMLVNGADDWIALYAAVKAIESRLKGGKLPLKAQRTALLAALTKVDA